MLYFQCDYLEGAHEQVLRRLVETNREKLVGYGEDVYCQSAREKIRAACGAPQADVFFLVGGTQTNAVVIDSMLAPYEGVISARTGHINMHEAGAIEFTGHKVLSVDHCEGKIDARTLENTLEAFWQDESHEHMVFPGMVYISFPTEYGTLYTLRELTALAETCRRYHIPLYADGARLGYGLVSPRCDVTLEDIARLCEVFYIGGTKVGALCGEAVVFPRGDAPRYFLTRVKRHGAMLAKGRLAGVQFDALFTDGLYWRISRHAMDMALRMREGLEKLGYPLFLDSPTNQQFVVLENGQMERLREKVGFSVWEKADARHTVVRFATSWATEPEDVDALLALLAEEKR